MRARPLLILLYTCSGAAGLIYEIVWMRLFSLHLGNTVAATGTVLAAFLGGLAFGALVGGRMASDLDRARALRSYAVLEFLIALCAFLLPFALDALDPLLKLVYGDGPSFAFALGRIASGFALVFVPAAAMGATLPLVMRWFVRTASAARREAGSLYAFNTAGAAAGALATGFVLIPAVGLRASTFVGIALNALAGWGGWFIARRSSGAVTAPATPVPSAVGRPTRGRSRGRASTPAANSWGHLAHRSLAPRWLPGSVLAISGVAALLYELTFTRVLALVLGPTTYAFAAMLTAFISGLALGAAVTSRIAWGEKTLAFWLGVLMLASAAAASGAGWFAGMRLPVLIAETVADPSIGPVAILTREVLYAAGVLLPLACLLGAAFPVAIALAARSDDGVAGDVAVVYSANSIGAVAGSLAGAFVLLPVFGLEGTLRLAGLLAVGAGCLAFLAGRLTRRQRLAAVAAALVSAALLFGMPDWDPNLLAAGGYKYAPRIRDPDLDLRTRLTAGRLLYYKEGATATVSVRQLAGTISLAIDGKVDASNQADMVTQQLLAHLPLLLHPDPRKVGIIGLGSGVTLAAALQHGIDRADVLEISPEVVEASSFFVEENGGALADPRTRLIIGDGRSHLRLTSERYDVIISEPSNPWMAGVAALFTREFFLAARERLEPGGILCQWAHTYDIADEDLRSIAATVASVFPNVTMWLVGEGDVLLIASTDAAGPTLHNIARFWQRPGVAADLMKASVMEPFSLLSLYIAGPQEVQRYSEGAVIQTDDRMQLEFSGPRAVYRRRPNENARVLQALLDPAQAPAVVRAALASAGAREWNHRGQMFLRAHAYGAAYADFLRAAEIDPDNEVALTGLIDAAGARRQLGDVQRVIELQAKAQPEAAAPRRALARLLAATGAYEQAASYAGDAIIADPESPRGVEVLASIFADAGDIGRLRPLATRMQHAHPEREETWYYAAMLSFLEGEFGEAIALGERVIQRNGGHAPAHNLIGAASASLGQHDRARQAFRASLEASPLDPATYANLGLLELESGNRDAAAAYFAESLTLEPHFDIARTGLAAILAGR